MKSIKLFNSFEEAKLRMENRRPILISIGNKKYCGIRAEDQIFVVDDTCPHSGALLHEGSINHLNEIICPLHNYRFSIKDGRECNNRTNDLETFPIEITDNGIFIKV